MASGTIGLWENVIDLLTSSMSLAPCTSMGIMQIRATVTHTLTCKNIVATLMRFPSDDSDAFGLAAIGITVDDVIDIFFFGIRIEYKYMYKMTQSKSHATIVRDIFLHLKRRLQVLSLIRMSVGFILVQIVFTIIFQ
jgi:hypothetical protein